MSRIVVVGGHGRTGMLIVQQLIKKGETVVATIRNPKHMADMVKAGAETVILDLEKSTGPDFTAIFKGADAIVFAAGSGEGESSEIDAKGVQKTVRAALSASVPRYVAISAIGATTKVPKKWDTPDMKDYWAAKRSANKAVRKSSLKWTIVEPGELTEAKGTGKITLSEDEIDVAKISRADLAATVVAVLAEPGTIGKVLQVVGGKTAIGTAIKKAAAA